MNRPICIIDDDEDVREVMCFALEFEGIQTMTFGSATQAEAYLKNMTVNELPSLIIIDYMMPDMNGLEFIQHVTKKYPYSLGSIPLAICTARFSDELQGLPESVIQLPKPLDLSDLIAVAKKFYFTPGQICSSF